MSYTTEDRYCQRDELRIYGKLFLPETEEGGAGPKRRFSLAIFAHEFHCRYTRGETYGAMLADAGIALYTFDFCGNSDESFSDGVQEDQSVKSNIQDLVAVYNMAKEWPEIDPERIFFIGASQGGYAAAEAASMYFQDTPLLCLLYPAFSMTCFLTAPFADVSEIPEKTEYMFGGTRAVHGKGFIEDLWYRDPYGDIKNYGNPVLILQGTDDWYVPLCFAKAAQLTFPDAELIIYDGCKHLFRGEWKVRAAQDILAFIKKKRPDLLDPNA